MKSASASAKTIEDHFSAKPEVRRYVEVNPTLPRRLREVALWLEADLRANGLTLEIKALPSADLWSERYTLTPAETRLAEHLLRGGTTDGYASARRVSRHTVRNQLRSIYAKTNTNRQVSLLQLLLRAVGRNP